MGNWVEARDNDDGYGTSLPYGCERPRSRWKLGHSETATIVGMWTCSSSSGSTLSSICTVEAEVSLVTVVRSMVESAVRSIVV